MRNKILASSLAIFLMTIVNLNAQNKTYYVTQTGSSAADGTSWTNALNEEAFRSKLSNAQSGDIFYVAKGTYKPGVSGDRSATFSLKAGVKMYGGFAGNEESISLEARDLLTNVTILSGDIDANDIVTGTGSTLSISNNTGNSYHVVVGGSGANTTNTELNGFTISGGNANVGSLATSFGGGMYNDKSSPKVANCIFTNNSASNGGGMHNTISANPLVTNCSFINNLSANCGGGLRCNENTSSQITNCLFIGNKAIYGGGAYLQKCTSTVLINCTFVSNNASKNGGAICFDECNPKATNCTLWKNSANDTNGGGGIYNYANSNPTINNSIIWGNTASSNAQILGGDVTKFKYCIIDGWNSGGSNISDDPLLVNLAANGGPTQTCAIPINSPAVGAGTTVDAPTTDQRGLPRNVAGTMGNDIGAYQQQIGNRYLITSSVTEGSGGSIFPVGENWLWVGNNANKTFRITPSLGYEVDNLKVDGTAVNPTPSTSYVLENVTNAHTVNVKFKAKTYSVTISAVSNGTISPAGTSQVVFGESKTYSFAANAEYELDYITITNIRTNSDVPYTSSGNTFSFVMPADNVAITVSFSKLDPVFDARNIDTAEKLKTFCEKVNGLNSYTPQPKLSGKLTADIDLSEKNWTPIGTMTNPYTGIFDGNGFKIKNINVNITTPGAGLFGCATENATFKNLIIESGIIKTTDVHAGGILGRTVGQGNSSFRQGTIKFENCGNYATIESTQNSGGILGCNFKGHLSNNELIVMTNCFNAGAIQGNSENAGLAGFLGDKTVITNCYNTGTVTNGDANRKFARPFGTWTFTNCYQSYNVETSSNLTNVTIVNSLQFESGEIAYLLDKGNTSSRTTNWTQKPTVGAVKSHPVFSNNANSSTYKISGTTSATGITTVTGPGGTGTTNNYANAGSTVLFTTNGQELSALSNNDTPLGFSGTNPEYSFTMPKSDLVLTATYSFNALDINTAAKLKTYRDIVNTSNQGLDGKLTADIDLSGTEWMPIGTQSKPFTGTFNGNGYKVTSLSINKPTTSFIGLFGYAVNATIKNIGLVNAKVEGDWNTGTLLGKQIGGTIENAYSSGSATVVTGKDVGGLVGFQEGGTITDSYTKDGIVTAKGVAEPYFASAGGILGVQQKGLLTRSNSSNTVNGTTRSDLGGLVGKQEAGFGNSGTTGDATISYSFATGSLNKAENLGCVGGLVGWQKEQGGKKSIITHSYATGSVTRGGTSTDDAQAGGLLGGQESGLIEYSYATGAATATTGSMVGGLVGRKEGGIIRNSYATGTVTGNSSVGGLVGEMVKHVDNRGGSIASTNDVGSIINSYAIGSVTGNSNAGGLVGYINNVTYSISDSYWDTQTSGITISAGTGAVGKSTEEMKKANTFAVWDIDKLGGENKGWRIYEEHTYPLIKSFMSELQLTATSSITDNNKTYNGSEQQATVNSLTYSAPAGSDANLIKGSAIALGNKGKNVGSYPITLGGVYSVQHGYDFKPVSLGTLTISQASLTLTPQTDTKSYDGTVDSKVSVQITGLQNGDTFKSGSLKQVFANSDVNSSITLSVAPGYEIQNTANENVSGNYTITANATAQGEITQKVINVSGITAADKTYDGNTDATLNLSEVSFPDKIEGDILGVSSASGTFDNKNVGNNKLVNINNIVLNGTKASNYSVNNASTTANISKADLSLLSATRDYNGTSIIKGSDFTEVKGVGEEKLTITGNGDASNLNSINANANYVTLNSTNGLSLNNGSKGELASNYTFSVLNSQIIINKATISTMTFSNNAFTYDGQSKSLSVSNLPINLAESDITYSYNNGSNNISPESVKEAGTYTVTASVTNHPNYINWTRTATLTINKATLSGISFTNRSEVYDGNAKSLTVSNLPSDLSPESIVYTYQKGGSSVNANEVKDAGEYSVTASLTDHSNYENFSRTVTLTINKATITGISFPDNSYNYDGTAKSLAISGLLPDGATVSYTNNGRTEAGAQVVTANINGGINYQNTTLTATLTINKATISNIAFDNATVVYDGSAKSLTVSNLPPNLLSNSIDYEYKKGGNVVDQTTVKDVGEYSVKASVTNHANYANWDKTVVLTISKAQINGITFTGKSEAYDGAVKSLSISGTLPVGASVQYSGNGQTIPGTYPVTANISGGSNYNDLTLSANLVITQRDIADAVVIITDQTFTGSQIKPTTAVTVKIGSHTLSSENDYDLSYGANINAGTNAGEVILTGKGYYSGTKTVNFNIGKANITGITFNDISFKHDGTEKSHAISGTLPAGTSVTYTNGKRADFGSQMVTANINGGTNYNNQTITATLTINPYITSTAGANGTISPSGDTEVNYNTSKTISFNPSSHYEVDEVKVDGVPTSVSNNEYTFSNVTANHTIVVTFKVIVTPTYTITASAQPVGGGSISPSGSVTVTENTFKTFTIEPAIGYLIKKVVVDEEEKGAISSHTFNNVTGNHAITAYFKINVAPTVNHPYVLLSYGEEANPLTANALSGCTLNWYNTSGGGTALSAAPVPNTHTIGNSSYWVSQVDADGNESPRTQITVQVNKSPLTLTPVTDNKTFDGTINSSKSVLYNSSQLKNGDTFESGTLTQVFDSKMVGARTLSVKSGYKIINTSNIVVTDNYEINSTATTIGSIARAPLSISSPTAIGGFTKTYDGNTTFDKNLLNPSSVSGLIADNEVSVSVLSVNYNSPLVNSADHLVVTYQFANASDVNNDNYILPPNSTVSGNIIPLKVALNWSTDALIYTGNLQQITATVNNKAILSDEVNVATYDDNSHIDAGDNYVAFATSLNGAQSGNYALEGGSNLSKLWSIGKGTISGITFSNGSFTYDGTAKSLIISGTLPNGTAVSYTGNAQTNAGTHEVVASISGGSNYNDLTLRANLIIQKSNIAATLADKTIVYDGQPHSLSVSNLPINLAESDITYSYNNGSNIISPESVKKAGIYTVTASVTNHPNYTNWTQTATLTINKATLSGISFTNRSEVYDGNTKSLTVSNLPSDLSPESIVYTYKKGSSLVDAIDVKEAGTYSVTASLTNHSNYNDFSRTAILTIDKATITGISFPDNSYNYDGTAKSLAISGLLPDGATVSYTNNGRTEAGTQTVTANINGGINYQNTTLTATLTINKATISNIAFENATVVYDGSAKSLTASNLPLNLLSNSIVYEYKKESNVVGQATVKEVGTYSVKASVTNHANYADWDKTVVLTISKAQINGITFTGKSEAYDGAVKSLSISGTLPVGASVNYSGNGQTIPGTYPVTANISGGSNYNDLTLSANLVITRRDIANAEVFITDQTFTGSQIKPTTAVTVKIGSYTLSSESDYNLSYGENLNVGNSKGMITIVGKGYYSGNKTVYFNIGKANITGITFNDISFKHDGTEKSHAISGTLPAGTSVTYTNEKRADFGSQSVTAHINGGTNYNDQTITATLTINPYITSTAGANGTISPSGDTEVNYNTSKTISFNPYFGYEVDKVIVDGLPVSVSNNEYKFDDVVINHTIEVTFIISEASTYTITATAQPVGGGSISPSGSVTVTENTSKTFTIEPAIGYLIKNVVVDGVDMGEISSHKFDNVTGDHAITAYFKINVAPTVNQPHVLLSYGEEANPLTANALSGCTLHWYNTSGGGTALSAAPVPNTLIIGNSSYWVSQVDADGNESPRTEVSVNVSKANIVGIIFANQTVKYDGQTHALSATKVPSYVTSVNYSYVDAVGNTSSNAPSAAGVYTVTASIAETSNYNAWQQTAMLTIESTTNQAPIAHIVATNLSVNEGETANLDASNSYDPDGDALHYTWTAPAGVTIVDGSTATPTFTAPFVTADTEITVSLVVSDGNLSSEAANVVFTVKNVNAAPVANAGEAQTVNEGAVVTLHGSATDAENDAVTFAWTAPEGITLSANDVATPTFTAPKVEEQTEYTFSLIASDGKEKSEPATVVVTVKAISTAPIAHAGEAQTVKELDLVTLDASASKVKEGATITYAWTAPTGVVLSDATVVKPTFTAPEVDADTEYTFTLKVSDGKLQSEADTVKIMVKNVPATLVLSATFEGTALAANQVSYQLYKKVGTSFVENTSNLTTNGNETSFALEAGEWIVLASPVDGGPNFVPTYTGGTDNWTNATLIAVPKKGSVSASITCMAPTVVVIGTGEISGYVFECQTIKEKSIAFTKDRNGNEPPVPGALVLLYKKGEAKPVASCLTDSKGYFKFEKLAIAEYELTVEIPGYTQAVKLPIAITEKAPESSACFGVNTTTQVITDAPDALEAKFSVWPNPVVNELNISLSNSDNSPIGMELYDMNGALLSKHLLDGAETTIDMSGYTPGIYLLKVVQGQKVWTKKLIKK